MNDYETATAVDEDDDQPFRPQPTPLELLHKISQRLAWTNALLFFLLCATYAMLALTVVAVLTRMIGCG